MEIGAQLFTVRDFCKDPSDLATTLARIADIGYRHVQVSGTCAYEATWLRDELLKNGLSCVLTHTPAARIQEETDSVIRDHGVFGCDYIGLGYYKFEPAEEKYREFCEKYAPAAERIAAGGKYFMYHNHAGEFQKLGDKTILARLAEDFPAEHMGFTLDTYWIQVGGGDPAAWIEKLSGRVPCIHLKDYAYGQKMAVVGEGNINFDRVFAKAEDAGTKYMLVEQDNCNGEDPFDCLKRSYAYLKSRGFS
ncbi:MAG: sugar phosphate isomerase/epimerase [Clostridia bacterium]|nr:sugar phosphate isomerase/epimerase [Clostridia bacterium]